MFKILSFQHVSNIKKYWWYLHLCDYADSLKSTAYLTLTVYLNSHKPGAQKPM